MAEEAINTARLPGLEELELVLRQVAKALAATANEIKPIPRAHVPQPGDLYQHARTGNFYVIVTLSKFSEAPELELVTYRNLRTGEVWTRPLRMFMSRRTDGDAVAEGALPRPRFAHLEVNIKELKI